MGLKKFRGWMVDKFYGGLRNFLTGIEKIQGLINFQCGCEIFKEC